MVEPPSDLDPELAPDLARDLPAALASPSGRRLRAAADRAWTAAARAAAAGRGPVDPLRVATAVRRDHPRAPADLVAAALTQAALAQAARPRLGPDVADLVLTRAGAQQATRRPVADRRARRLADAGARVVADLGCGLGLDARALARAGLDVVAVESDPATAAAAAANAGSAGPGRVRVLTGDVTDPDLLDGVLAQADTVFVDPARRGRVGPVDRPGRVPAERDPARWSPPWPWVRALAQRRSRVCAKVAPGIPLGLVPPDAQVEWVSVDGDLVEATVWCAGLAQPGWRRRAAVLRTGPGDRVAVHLLADGPPPADRPSPAPVGAPGGWLLEPDEAVVRAGLVADLAARVGGRLPHRESPWIGCDRRPDPGGLARVWQVLDVLPAEVRPLRAALRARGIGAVQVKTRGAALRPEELRRRLRLAGAGPAATLVVIRTGSGLRAALVTAPEAAPGPPPAP